MRLSNETSGLQLIPQMWELEPNLQIVICTSFSDPSLHELQSHLPRTDQWIIQKKTLDTASIQQISRAQVTKWNMLQQMQQQFEEIKRLNQLFEQYVPMQLLSRIQEKENPSFESDQLQTEHLTVLFCDIRNFTGISEVLSPQDTLAFLNSYLNRMGKVIMKHQRFIDKFIGDGLMAMIEGSEAAKHAVEASIEMQISPSIN